MNPPIPVDQSDAELLLRCPYYCEENVWRLLSRRQPQQSLSRSSCHTTTPVASGLEHFVVFCSNETKTVAMMHQKAARGETMIVWDYHVILLCYQSLSDLPSATNHPPAEDCPNTTGVPNNQKAMLVYDMDTTLYPYPMLLSDYLRESFPTPVMARYRPQFRVLSGEHFYQYFSSDRSHMLHSNVPPPPYDCIGCHHQQRQLRNTLPYYLDFAGNHKDNDQPCPIPEEALGIILSLEELYQVDRWRAQLRVSSVKNST